MARDFAKKLYSSEQWQQLRMALIAERGPVCQQCGKNIARPADIIAHHEIELSPENIRDFNISINPNFIKLICFDCHNKSHKRFGYLPENQVYLVFGPPLSGKKTYVRENMQRGDLVVDMDCLYAAVSFFPAYDKPDNLFSNVIGIYNLLLDNIKCRYGRWNNTYVIGGFADKYKRERLAEDLGAELVFCDVDMEECLRRLELDEDRSFRKDEWAKYINKWFEEYVS